MKIFSTSQIRAWDAFTIEQEPIASESLMERAGRAVTDWLAGRYEGQNRPLAVFAGTGNNGGDGLVIARYASFCFSDVYLFIVAYNDQKTRDFLWHYEQLTAYPKVKITVLQADDPFPEVAPDAIVADALLGSGLSRPLSGPWVHLVTWLNSLPNERIAVDVPSGLFCDQYTPGIAVHATYTLTFERPKRAFFFPENAEKVGDWQVLPIGLHPLYEQQTATPFHYLTAETLQPLLSRRSKFAHKGDFGHALLWMGSHGKTGAAILAARACLRAGVGLLTVQGPRCAMLLLQTAVPEAMYKADRGGRILKMAVENPGQYRCIGMGCGIGTEPETAQALAATLQNTAGPLVLDADALNLLALHPEWWPLIPENSILTPHPKEFERLFGKTAHDFERNDLQRAKAQEHRIILILKGGHTAIALPDGHCWFNSTGNPGMATGGSGDVLSGILTGLLAQGYAAEEAALLGIYLHGLAGDLAAAEQGEAAVVASDLIEYLGRAWQVLQKSV